MASSLLHNPVTTVNGMTLYFSDDVAIIVMDRGQNRINKEFVEGFKELLDLVESNETCKGLITTGIGKFYCNGLDLEKFANSPQNEVTLTLLLFRQLLHRLLLFPVPTLACLNGHAFAGGGLLAFVHDLRTMRTDRGWICMNEVFLNLQFQIYHLKVLEYKIGTGPILADCLVLGKRYKAEEARQVGMVHSVQPQNLLMSESVHLLRSFYGPGYPRESLDLMKRDVYREVVKIYENQNTDADIENAHNQIFPPKPRL